MKRLNALLSQNTAWQTGPEKGYADRHANDLWTAISPHIRRLAAQADGHDNLHPSSNESLWLEAFDTRMAQVIQQALIFRMRLTGTACEYSFTWPQAGTGFDSHTMRTNAASEPDSTMEHIVAFTMFPGLEVTAVDLNDGQPEVVCRAMVKLITPSAFRTFFTTLTNAVV